MKRNPFFSTIAALLCACVALLAGCEEPGPVRVTAVTMTGTLRLIVGESRPLGATVHPADATNNLITWQIEDPEVISYDQATMQVRGLKTGRSAIYAAAGGKYAQCEVTVVTPGEDILAGFPDPEFREYLTDHWDRDKNGMISLAEAERVNIIDLFYYDVNTLEGIEMLPNLIRIRATSYRGETLDLSGNTRIEELDIRDGGNRSLTSVDLSGCSALRLLYISFPNLTTLDISGTALESDEFMGLLTMTLKTLKAGNCTRMESFSCLHGVLTSLDLSGSTALTNVSLGHTPLSSLDLSGCTALTKLSIVDTPAFAPDLSGCTALTTYTVSNTSFTSLDLSGLTALTSLVCPGNLLTTLDISECTSLLFFSCLENPGEGGEFVVKAWFDNDSVPAGPVPGLPGGAYYFSQGAWHYNEEPVFIRYEKVI